MNRSIIKLLVLSMAFFASCGEPDVPSKKTNIVLIVIDDLGYGDLGRNNFV